MFEKEKCEDCRFFKATSEKEGNCQYYPPESNDVIRFPIMEKTDFCGHHEREGEQKL